MRIYYVCDENKDPVETDDFRVWALWYEGADRTIGLTETGDAKVSTVFLGLNHNFGPGPSLLYETMVFGGALDGETERYPTRQEAQEGHQVMVARVRAAERIDK